MSDCDFSCAKYGVFIFNFFIAVSIKFIYLRLLAVRHTERNQNQID